MTDFSIKQSGSPPPIIRRVVIGLIAIIALTALAAVMNPQGLPMVVFLMAVAYLIGLLNKHREKLERPDDRERPAPKENPTSNTHRQAADIKKGLDEAAAKKVKSLVKKNHELLVLYSLANVVASSLELSEVLSVALESAIKIFGAKAGEISVIGAPEETHVMYYSGATIVASHQGADAPRLSRRLSSAVAKSGVPIITRLGNNRDKYNASMTRVKGISKLAVFPIKTKRQILGTITLACSDDCAVGRKDQEILTSIGAMIGSAIENSQLYQRLKWISDTDAITGLYNHRFITKKLNAELRRASRYGHSVSVLMLDVDRFKEINDNFGHPFGDKALKKIALATVAACRETDFVGRYGGDEFLLVLPETKAKPAVTVSDRVRRYIQSLSLSSDESKAKVISISASLGLAVYPDSGKNSTELIVAADKNLYLSKSAGGDQVTGKQVA